MADLPKCPKCSSQYTYEDGTKLVCPECAHEWAQESAEESAEESAQESTSQAGGELVVKDAHGTALANGDTVIVTKDLKLKGSASVVKVGTKVKNIRLVEGDHNIDCKIDGIGAMSLKSEFVRKAK